jgi:hypothetical protein
LKSAQTLWETVFPGKPVTEANKEFLNKPRTTRFIGFREKIVYSKEYAEAYKLPESKESIYTILQQEKINNEQFAVLVSKEIEGVAESFWVSVDGPSKNVLGIYDMGKNLVTEKVKLKKIKEIVSDTLGAASSLREFLSNTVAFADLTRGEGMLGFVFNVKSYSSAGTFNLNGSSVAGQTVHMDLKKKLIRGNTLGKVFGMTNIKSVDLYTIPSDINLPIANGLKVIGYKVTMIDGTISETVLNSFQK